MISLSLPLLCHRVISYRIEYGLLNYQIKILRNFFLSLIIIGRETIMCSNGPFEFSLLRNLDLLIDEISSAWSMVTHNL